MTTSPYKVTVRQKIISNNKKSLYLDIYPPIPHPETGKPTRRQFLKIYIHSKPRTAIEKQHNKENLQLAEQIRHKKENDLKKPEIYSSFEREQIKKQEKGKQDFIEYFEKQRKKVVPIIHGELHLNI